MLNQPGTGGAGNTFNSEGGGYITLITLGMDKLRLQAGVVKHRPGVGLGCLALIRAFGKLGTVAVVTLQTAIDNGMSHRFAAGAAKRVGLFIQGNRPGRPCGYWVTAVVAGRSCRYIAHSLASRPPGSSVTLFSLGNVASPVSRQSAPSWAGWICKYQR